jgi:hypothetical protein
MKIDLYTFTSVIVLPLTVIHFCLDYLRDRDINHSEFKIGMLQYIHHYIVIFNLSGTMLLPFFYSSLPLITVNILILYGAQVGYIMNDDFCWLTKYINGLITGNPKRKWIADLPSLIKHYIRGDTWAYSDVHKIDNTVKVTISNLVFLFILIKYCIKKNK